MTGSAAAYSYRAARRDGALESGVINADARERALAMLRDRGLFPLELQLESEPITGRARLALGDLAQGLGMLATLLEAALPMERALAALEEMTPPSWRRLHPHLRDSVREGKSLGAALADAPVAIPPVVAGMVHAGEQAGRLAAAIRRAAALMEETAATRAAVQQALVYPVLLAAVGAASVAILAGVVIPRFALIIADLGQALPPSTRLVLQGATFLEAVALPALLGLALLTMAWRLWVSSESGRERWHELLLATPIVGRVRLAAGTSRAAGALSALLDAGVPIAPALQRAAQAAGDSALERRVLNAREAVVGGARLSASLAKEEAVTGTAVRLVRAGEESGRLGEMLAHAARLEAERAQRTVRAAVRLIEPMLILTFGALVALVAAALLQAVYAVRPG